MVELVDFVFELFSESSLLPDFRLVFVVDVVFLDFEGLDKVFMSFFGVLSLNVNGLGWLDEGLFYVSLKTLYLLVFDIDLLVFGVNLLLELGYLLTSRYRCSLLLFMSLLDFVCQMLNLFLQRLIIGCELVDLPFSFGELVLEWLQLNRVFIFLFLNQVGLVQRLEFQGRVLVLELGQGLWEALDRIGNGCKVGLFDGFLGGWLECREVEGLEDWGVEDEVSVDEGDLEVALIDGVLDELSLFLLLEHGLFLDLKFLIHLLNHVQVLFVLIRELLLVLQLLTE